MLLQSGWYRVGSGGGEMELSGSSYRQKNLTKEIFEFPEQVVYTETRWRCNGVITVLRLTL